MSKVTVMQAIDIADMREFKRRNPSSPQMPKFLVKHDNNKKTAGKDFRCSPINVGHYESMLRGYHKRFSTWMKDHAKYLPNVDFTPASMQ